jgi:hypothetical protein
VTLFGVLSIIVVIVVNAIKILCKGINKKLGSKKRYLILIVLLVGDGS